MSAAVPRQTHEPLLRTGISVADDGGRLHASVDLHGDLCAITTPQLRVHLDRLMDDGVADITVDLSGLRLCTSDGLHLWEETHDRLAREHGGTLCLLGARGVVQRILDRVGAADPTFGPSIGPAHRR